MKVIVIDDEKAMHLILKRMLSKMEGVEITGCFLETATAFAYMLNHEVDVIFLDISMPRESGLEFAERLRESGKQTKLVFITSHKDYALHAFDVYAFDYIVKPVVQERLYKTVQRALAECDSERMVHADSKQISETVFFNCLGGIDIRSAQGDRVKWKSSKSAELFGYLLMHKGRLVSRARLIDDIFSGMEQKNAEIYLNTTVYKLRKVLDLYGLKEILHSDISHYALNLSRVRVDVHIFEEDIRKMAIVNEANIDQALQLEQSFTGELFGEYAFNWALNEVERVSLMYHSFCRRLCEALCESGDVDTAVRLLLKLKRRNPIDEETIMQLLSALAKHKNKEAVIQHYRQFAQTLQQDIGIEPSNEVTMLYEQLLVNMDV
ncbi:response regulator [Paenibacillus sp. YIM B09110]|uniref:response regulator n=1 Tax=Paenibacillus sp. YIM B09110 TaxID=3126102 RepID=UPI00301CA071